MLSRLVITFLPRSKRLLISWLQSPFPVVMYGCESWTVKKAECQRNDAFELWCWRILLRVPWTARRSNQSILKEINSEYSLERLMLKLKLHYFGHLMQKADSFEKTLMLGKIEGRRTRGQQRIRWLDGITDSMDREAWHDAVHGFAKRHNWAELNYDFINISETFCHLCFTDILFVLYYCLYYKYYDYSNIHSFPSFSYYCLLKNLQFLSPNHNYLDHFILEPRLTMNQKWEKNFKGRRNWQKS